MKFIVLIGLLSIFTWEISIAQNVENVSDTDLKALFCLSIIDEQIKGVQGIFTDADKQGDIYKTTSEKQLKKRKRITDYLSSKGYGTYSDKPLEAMILPMNQGKNIFKECLNDRKKSQYLEKCINSPAKRDDRSFDKCVLENEPKSCMPLKKCETLDFLPF